jgi:hypothetical protein
MSLELLLACVAPIAADQAKDFFVRHITPLLQDK